MLFKTVLLLQLTVWLFTTRLLFAENNPIQSNQQQLQDVQIRIKNLQNELVEQETTKGNTISTLRMIERSINSLHNKLLQIKQQQAELGSKLDRLRQSSEQLRGEIRVKQTQMGKLLYFQNLIHKSDYLSLLLKQKNPDEITRKLFYYRYLARHLSENMDELRNLHERLTKLTQIQHDQYNAFKQSQRNYFEQMELLTKQKSSHAELLAILTRETSEKSKALSGLKQDEKRLSELVAKLNRQMIQKKIALPENISGKPLLRNNQLPSTSPSDNSFASMKGRLQLPVRGELVNRFGSPREQGGIKWNGLFIRAANGNEVKAVANGQVIFAEWIRGFGNFIIIDHGNHYMSLYGHNETLIKRVGDKVRVGDTISVVGNSGGNLQSGLYFELRYKGVPFDPLTWTTPK